MALVLTRRSLVSAAPAALVAATISAHAAAVDDGNLLALRPLWLKARAEFGAALDVLNAAETRFHDACPDFPDLKTWQGSMKELDAESSRVRSIHEALKVETGVAAHQLEDQTSDADSEMVARIAAIPARTKEGIRFKREVLRDWKDCQRDDLQQSIMADLLAMTGDDDA